MDKFIYRYKYLPDMVGIEGVVGSGTIKFTNPKDFNDPFDCFPSSKFGSYSGMRAKNPQMYESTIGRISNPAKRILAQQRMLGAMQHKVLSGEMLDIMIHGASVLALSKIPDSILMWSHYAGYHKGAVVEFKIPVDINFQNINDAYYHLIALDVFYSKSRPVLEYNAHPSNPETILNTLFMTKSDVWSYEQESRVLKNTGGGGIFPDNKKLLNAVVVGPRSPYLKDIISLARKASLSVGHKIEVFKAEFCASEYAVKIPRFCFKKDD